MCVVLCVERRMAYGVVVSIIWESSLSFLVSFASTLASKLLDDAYTLVESTLLIHQTSSGNPLFLSFFRGDFGVEAS